MSDTEKILSLFVAESQIYEEFRDCKYVIDILGFGRNAQQKLCIALEYMDLRSLSNINYALSESHLQYISFCVVSALKALHSKKYIHNDVKPDNILLSNCGDVRLSDMGCCVQMNLKKDVSMTDQICGSKQYFAPEKWLISPPE